MGGQHGGWSAGRNSRTGEEVGESGGKGIGREREGALPIE